MKVSESFNVMEWEMEQAGIKGLGQEVATYDQKVLSFIQKSFPKTYQFAEKYGFIRKAIDSVAAFLTGRSPYQDKWTQILVAKNNLIAGAEQLKALAENSAKKVDTGVPVSTDFLVRIMDSAKEVRRRVPEVFGWYAYWGTYKRPDWVATYLRGKLPPHIADAVHKWAVAISQNLPLPTEVPTLEDPRERTKRDKARDRMASLATDLMKALTALHEAERLAATALRDLGKPAPPAPKEAPVTHPPVKISPWMIAVPAIGGLIALLLFLRK